MTDVAQIDREFRAHQERIASIYALTRQVAGQTNATVKQVTADAVRELEAINARIRWSNLPEAQKAQLRAQVDQALCKHAELLSQATTAAQRTVQHAGSRPLPQHSGWNDFSESIDTTVHALTGGIFRRR